MMKTIKKYVKLVRYGALNPLKQKHYKTNYEEISFHTTPERYGFYAFLYPYIETFLLSGTGKDTKKTPFKRFSVNGYIWTHIECPKYIEKRGDWFKVHSSDFNDFFPKYFAQEIGSTIDMFKRFSQDFGRNDEKFKLDLTIKNPYRFCSKDHLEIFVPHYSKIKPFNQML